MSEIKWIKITTTMFENEKIDFIESLPESDSILVIWIKLLTLAGKCNMNGYIFLTENIPYNDEMLAHKFRRQLNTVRLAFETFRKLGMIEIEDGIISISNWDKHQNIDGMEKIKEQNRLRKQKQREKQKLLPEVSRDSHGTVPSDVTQCHATDIDKELDINNKEEEANPFRFYEENGFGTLSPVLTDKINDWIDHNQFDFPKLIIIMAMEEAVLGNVRKWNYINSTLNDWHQNNLRTVDQVQAYLSEHKKKNKNASFGKRKDALSILRDL